MERVKVFQLTVTLGVILFSTVLSGQPYRKVFDYISPIPDAKFVSKETTIIMRPVDRVSITDISIMVRGFVSGVHDGTLLASDDGETIIFLPASAFFPAEKVTVTIQSSEIRSHVIFHFHISNTSENLVPRTFEEYHQEFLSAPPW